jgi:uncharacterized protein YbjT (DUF2867 family)
MSQKTIAIVGATGAQGGGLARAILDNPTGPFKARVLTRDPTGTAARQFADRGAEVVAADVDDPASLRRAFEGAWGAYCVTFFWQHFSPDKEMAQAKAMADAARAARLQHVIWSTLEDTRVLVPLSDNRMPTLQGRFKVPHFDAKGESDRFFEGLPTTYTLASFYWDNFINLSGPRRGPDGKLTLALPIGDGPMAGIAAEDIGRCAYGVFNRSAQYVGQRVGFAGEHLTGVQMAAALGRALKQEVVFAAVPPDQFRAMGFPGAEDLGNMFQFYRDFAGEVNGIRDVARSRSLNPSLLSFEGWLARHAAEIQVG